MESKMPILNGKYVMLSTLGEGNTSKVYLASLVDEPKQYVAIKILREEFLAKDEDSRKAVANEVYILQTLKHPNIIRILEFGENGTVVKPSGRTLSGLVFIVLEFISGGLLFDLCQLLGGLGEEGGRFFFRQMIDSIEYMHSKNVSHRDLKLENILVDRDLNLKIADFGYASLHRQQDLLSSYRGTFTYMAPEIKLGLKYNGLSIDLFSTGVILFILIKGIFPFKEARKEEFFYNLLMTNKSEYWEKVQGNGLSAECRDILERLLSFNPENRPTLEQIKKHPWLTGATAQAQTQEELQNFLIQRIIQAQEEKQEQKSKVIQAGAKKGYRGDENEEGVEVVTDKQFVEAYKFNHVSEFTTEQNVQSVLTTLEEFRADCQPELQITSNNEKKFILIQNKEGSLQIKLKLYKIEDESGLSEPKLKLRFQKKKGSLQDQYEFMEGLTPYIWGICIPDSSENEESQ